SGTLTEPAQIDQYSFTAGAGQLLYVDGLAGEPSFSLNFDGPFGPVASAAPQNDAGPFLLLDTGTHTIRVRPQDVQSGAYSFRVLDFAAAPVLPTGTVTTGVLTPGNSTSLYSFTGTAGEHVYFDNLSNFNGQDDLSSWSVIDPNGHTIAASPLVLKSPFNNNDLDVTLPQDGKYTLVLAGGNRAGGVPFSFRADVAA